MIFGATMNLTNFLNRFFRSQVPCFVIITLMALACSTAAFCGGIHDAAAAGDLAKVKALLKDNPELVSSRDSNGNTALHLAAEKGRQGVAELLLIYTAEVNARNQFGWTPLHLAARNGHKDVAKLLLANKADLNAKDNTSAGYAPLHYAAEHGHKDIVELLRQNGGHE
jgi:ankyrin repeat protein